MNTANNNKFKTSQIVGLVIILASSIALFFTNRWAIDSCPFWKYMRPWNTVNITTRNLVLLALNIGLMNIIKAEVKNLDERGTVIQNYAAKWTFRFAVVFALMMGLLLNTNSNLLIYATVVQGYYLILFKVCMYRDSALVYMDEAQLKVFNKKMKKFFCAFQYSQGIICGGIVGYLGVAQHNSDAYILFLLIYPGICSLALVIYIHWKS